MSLKSFFANLLRKDRYTDWVALGKELMPTQKTLDQLDKEFQDYKYMQLRQICRNTTSIINARIVLKETIFKNRFEWLPKFASKCTNPECGMEYDKHVGACEKCKFPTREADVKQQTKADEFFISVNEFDQSLIELLQDAEDEVNITDHGWLWLQKEYEFLPFDGGDKLKLTNSKIKAIEKIFPEFIHHNLNKEGRHNDEWFCIEHRNEVYDKPGFCKKCGKELLKAWYVYKDKKNTVYYAKSEMIWWTFYDSKGYSPVYAILKNVLTEWGMDDELYERYWNKTLPKALLAVTTSNIESLRKERDYIIEKAKKNETPFIGIESQTGRGDIKKISLMDDSVTDLTNEPTRDLIRKVVNTVYGVVPLYAADTEHASALSGEGQQLMVQEDRAKAKQAIYNEMVLPQLLKELKVTDWVLQLKPPMEESEQRILDIEAKKIINARGMFDMGFDVELDDDGNFVYSGEAKQPEMTAPSPFTASMEKGMEKGRMYVTDPSHAPTGATLHQGPKGGYYYDTGAPKKEPKEPPKEKPAPKPEEPKKPKEKPSVVTGKIADKKAGKKAIKNHMKTLKDTSEGQGQLEQIRDYSGGGYGILNVFLRTGGKMRNRQGKLVNATKREKADFQEEMDKISTFLQNAPKTEGMVYRGMNFEKGDKKAMKVYNEFMSNISEGQEMTFPSFTSTTVDKETAVGFAGQNKPEKYNGVLIEMEQTKGVYLDGASAFESEDEILLDRSAKFVISKVEKHNGLTTIRLRENE